MRVHNGLPTVTARKPQKGVGGTNRRRKLWSTSLQCQRLEGGGWGSCALPASGLTEGPTGAPKQPTHPGRSLDELPWRSCVGRPSHNAMEGSSTAKAPCHLWAQGHQAPLTPGSPTARRQAHRPTHAKTSVALYQYKHGEKGETKQWDSATQWRKHLIALWNIHRRTIGC